MILNHLRRVATGFSGSVRLAVVVCGLAVSGCANLPVDGPSTADIVKQTDHVNQLVRAPYILIELNADVAAALSEASKPSLRGLFGDQPAVEESQIQPGDYVTTTIWEVGSAPLLLGATGGSASASTQSETVPEQIVSPDGTIVIPFAGHVQIAGSTVDEAEENARRSLRGLAMQPQVLISVTRNTSNNIAIIGDDIKGVQYTLAPNADRVLDAIAAAGGAQSPIYQARVQLIRDQEFATVGLQDLINSPGENIHLRPRDVLVVSKNPGFVTALGAMGHNAQIQIQNDHMTLAEALGTAGGLIDDRADPTGVFIFRYEARPTVEKLCPACDLTDKGVQVPVVYRLNMSHAQALFVAQRFQMTDHDVIFVSNSPQVQIEKLLSMVRDLASPILTGAVVARAVQN